jgi:hypothetical protein
MKVHPVSDGARKKPDELNGVPENPARREKALTAQYCYAVQTHHINSKKRP